MRHRFVHAAPVAVAVALSLAGCNQQSLSWAGGGKARYTILLYVVTTPTHKQDAERDKQTVIDTAGWDDIYVVHKAGWSELYRGRYSTESSAKRAAAKAKKYRTPAGGQPFVRATVMPLPEEDVGPPEWNMTRTGGMFTVAVAEFYDVPAAGYVGRKKFAVDCCRAFRNDGLEAYYYHGPAKSIVGIGSFGESAYPSVRRNGQFRRIVSDARMSDILKKFPNLAVNGREEVTILNPDSPHPGKVATASYIMEIPRD